MGAGHWSGGWCRQEQLQPVDFARTSNRWYRNADTPDGAWVHAYLHRKEGYLGNADYWYRRAGR
jgi:hypothetical protein